MPKDLAITPYQFDSNPFWVLPLVSVQHPPFTDTNVFDQNGYDLCSIEQLYADKNLTPKEKVRNHRIAIKRPWISQTYKSEGAVLNHAMLLERKGYAGQALEQLMQWAEKYPIFYRLTNIRPKWGLDFSMDYYDMAGNTFEVLHWEYDSFDYNEIEDKRAEVEQTLVDIDWEDAAKELLKRKNEWFELDFFAQSDYKCKYFGMCSERWKMVVWS
jgi:hypothetical protein